MAYPAPNGAGAAAPTAAPAQGLSIADATAKLRSRWEESDAEYTGADGAAEGEGAGEEQLGHDSEPVYDEGEEEVELEVAEGEDESDPDAEADEEPTSWALADLLEAAGVDASGITGTVTVQGEQVEVTLQEALRGYQRTEDYRRNNEALRAERAAAEQELSERGQQLDQMVEVLTVQLGAEEHDLKQQYQHWLQVEAPRLRAEDEGAYAARLGDFQRAHQELQARQQQLLGAVQKRRAEQQQVQQKRHADYVRAQLAKLVSLHEPWSDEGQMRAGIDEVRNYVKATYGVPDEALAINDAVTIDLFRKAMLFDQGQKKAPKVKRKVRKLLSPGARRGREERVGGTEQRLTQRLKKTGDTRDAVELMKHRLGRHGF